MDDLLYNDSVGSWSFSSFSCGGIGSGDVTPTAPDRLKGIGSLDGVADQVCDVDSSRHRDFVLLWCFGDFGLRLQ